jgi:hypothetical protein
MPLCKESFRPQDLAPRRIDSPQFPLSLRLARAEATVPAYRDIRGLGGGILTWFAGGNRLMKLRTEPCRSRLHFEIEIAGAYNTQLALFCWFCFEEHHELAGATGRRVEAKRPSDSRGDPNSELDMFNHFGRPSLKAHRSMP